MRIIIFGIILCLFSCKTDSGETNMTETTPPAIHKSIFGLMPDSTQVDLYVLETLSGVKIEIITYGGILKSIYVPDREGKMDDILLGHDDLKGYLQPHPYFGSLVGRYANRIANGQFVLDGETYQLSKNNGPNHLHGGDRGFDKVVWNAEEIKESKASGVRLSYLSKDMEEGYPGNLKVEVTYLLHEDGSLEIQYNARTDKRTVVNLTNHAYFNLGEDKSSILDHQLVLNADHFLPVDKTLIPTGELRPVTNTPFDFDTLKMIGDEIDVDNEQLQFGGGYDHCWVLNKRGREMSLAASLFEAKSGRKMDVYTTEPAIQFYTGNFLDGTIIGKNGTTYQSRSGLCLETQHFPDSPNQPQFPNVVLRPASRYLSTTKLVFSTD